MNKVSIVSQLVMHNEQSIDSIIWLETTSIEALIHGFICFLITKQYKYVYLTTFRSAKSLSLLAKIVD